MKRQSEAHQYSEDISDEVMGEVVRHYAGGSAR
jgi:hypothetical protein